MITNSLITGRKKGSSGSARTPVEQPNTLRSKAYARLILLLGSGEWHGLVNNLQSIYFDEVPLQNADGSFNFTDVSVEWRPGTINQPHLPYGSTAESTVSVGLELKCNQPITRVIRNSEVDIVHTTISVPQLVSQNTSNGDLSGTEIKYRIEYAAKDGVWRNVTGGYAHNSTPQNNITGAHKITGQVQVFAYSRPTGEWYWDEYYGESRELYLTVPVDFRVEAQKNNGEWFSVFAGRATTYGTTPYQSANDAYTRFNFELDADSGSTYNLRVNVLTSPQPTDKQYAPGFAWINTQKANNEFSIIGKTTSNYEKSVGFRLEGEAPWQIRVTRTTPDSTNSALINKTYWTSYSEVLEEKLSYPLSALIGVSLDASQFSSIPTVAVDCFMQVMRVPSNYDAWTRTYSGQWDGTFKMSWTDNPAWCFFHLLTDPVDGIGDLIEAERTEALKWDLYPIAKYCDELVPDGYGGMEPRFTCNLYLQQREKAVKALGDMASIFRGMIYEGAGGVFVSQDSPKPVTYLFTNANVLDGAFSYSSSHISTRHNVAKVTYTDRENFDKQAIEYVEDFESIATSGRINETSVMAVGCASRGQARRCGKWLLFTELNENEVVTFNTGLEGGIPRPGDVIEIADQFRARERMGGRTFGFTSTGKVKLDAVFKFDANSKYSIKIINQEGVVATAELKPLSGETDEIETVTPLDVPAQDSVYIISSDVLVPQTFRVVSIAEQDDGASYNISAMKYIADKYGYVEKNEPLSIPSTSKPGTLEPVGDVTINESLFESMGKVCNKVTLSWTPVRLAQSYTVSYRMENDNWISLPELTVPTVDLPDVMPGIYTFKVTARSMFGQKSEPTEKVHNIGGLLNPPASLTRFDIAALNDFALLSWDQPEDLDVRIGGQIKMRFSSKTAGATWGDATDIGGFIPGNVTQIQLPLLAGTYLAKPVDSSGIEAHEAVSVSTEYVAINEMATINGIAFHPEFNGTHNSTYMNGSLLTLNSLLRFDQWPSIDAVLAWDNGYAGALVGEWAAADIIDLDDVYNCRILAEVRASSLGEMPKVDEWGYIDELLDIDGATTSANIKIMVSVTQDHPDENNWGDWQEFYIGDWRGRAFRFKLQLYSDNEERTIVVEKFNVSLYMPGRLESANDVLIPAEGINIKFDRKFKYPPTVHLSVQSLRPGEFYKKTALNTEGFFVQIVDASGEGIPRTLDWIAKGYGYGSE